MFCIFGQNSKIQNGRHFWGGEIFFLKLPRVHSSDTLSVENFDEIALSRTIKAIEANLCFAIFGKNSKIQKGRHFWGGENFLKNWQEYIFEIPYGLKILTKSLYLAQLRRYKQICVLDIFVYRRPNLDINPTKKIGWQVLYHIKPPAKFERNLERNVDCRPLTRNLCGRRQIHSIPASRRGYNKNTCTLQTP